MRKRYKFTLFFFSVAKQRYKYLMQRGVTVTVRW
jgi:hypothetical protein